MPTTRNARDIFLAALELAPADRAAYLDEACGGDAALRVRVEALLRANDEPGAFLSEAKPAAPNDATGDFAAAGRTATFGSDAGATSDLPGRDEHVGAVLAGKYKLIEEIGEGGMGSVYMAQQTEPVKRAVAVKVIKAGMDSKAVLARFQAERQALAMMDHPNIARVLDAGTTEGGRPFFVMELVKGTPITQFCDERKLTPRQRLELFVPVCQAIQHAHQKGIIHRDIKPSNVLIALYDDRPVPKVIDFGVAKAAGQTLTDQTLMTGFGAIVGTPEYMSPEQANLNNLDIDTRSDVYSLGVMLYELLTGTTPVDRKSLGRAALLEVLRIVREVEAPRPSAKLSTIDTLPSVAANRGTEPKKLSKLMKGELDWVLLKALEKDRARRYETANALSRDIQRYLADEVVEARPPSAGYRLRKFVRRHKGQVIAASLVLLVLLGGIVGTTWGLLRAETRRVDAEQARADEADRVRERDDALKLEAERVKERDAAIGKRDHALLQEAERVKERDKANDELRHRLGVSSMVLAGAAYDNRDVKLAAERLALVPVEQRGWDWRYLKQQSRGGLFTLYGHKGPVTCVAFSPDGAQIVTGGGHQNQPGEVKVWDARTGSGILDLKGLPTLVGMNTPPKIVAFSPDGTRIITGGENNTAIVCDARTGAVLLELKGHTTPVVSVAYSRDGTRIITGGDAQPRTLHAGGRITGIQGPGEVKVWDARKGTPLLELKGHTGEMKSVSFSPDGTRIAGGGGDFGMPDETMVWDALSGKLVFEQKGNVNGIGTTVSFSPDGTRLAVGTDTSATVVDAQTGTTLLELKAHTPRGTGTITVGFGTVNASFSPDGTRIVTTGGVNGEATVWDAKTGATLLELKGHTSGVVCAAFSPDGTRIATGSMDGTLKLWDARTGSGRFELAGHRAIVHVVAFSPDNTRIVTGEHGKPGAATVWDARTGTALFRLKGLKGSVNGAAFSGDGTRIITGGGEPGRPGEVTVWDAQTGVAVLVLKGLKETVNSVAFSPDGTRIVTGALQDYDAGGGTELKVWDARTGKLLHDLSEPDQPIFTPSARGWSVAFSPDGTRIVAGGGKCSKSLSDAVKVVDARSGKVLLEMKTNKHAVLGVSFSPDSQRIVTANADSTATVWDAASGSLLLELKGHVAGVLSAAFSPDGTRIVTGSADRTLKVWDVRTGTALVELKGHTGMVRSASFNRDGTRIVSGGAGGGGEYGKPGEAMVWDARPVTDALELNGPTEHLHGASFSPDGTCLVTIDEKGGKVWDVPGGTLQFEMKGATGGVKSVAYSLDGTRIVTVNHDKSSRVWDAKTGQELPGELVPKTIPEERTSPDGRLFADVHERRVRFVSLKPDPEEMEHRRIHMQPNHGRYREGYLTARTAKDEFAARFYLNLLPPADRTAVEARADVDALAPMSRLAEEHLRVGKRKEALPLLVEIAKVKRDKLGPDDPDTLDTMIKLGVVYFRLGQFDKSIPTFEQAWKSREKTLGENDRQTLEAVANLAVNYKVTGRLPEAIPLLEKAYRAVKEHPELDWVAGELIAAYEEAGEYDKAARLLLERVPMARENLPKDSPQLGGFLAFTGTSLLSMKKWVEAEPVLREALAIREKALPDNWATFNTRSQLGGALLGQKKYAEAEPLLLAGYEGLKKRETTIPPPGKVRLPEALDRLIELSLATNKPDDAKKWRAERAKYPPEQAPPPRERN